MLILPSLIARFVWPAWGPSGADRTQVGPMFTPWTLLSGICPFVHWCVCPTPWKHQDSATNQYLGPQMHNIVVIYPLCSSGAVYGPKNRVLPIWGAVTQQPPEQFVSNPVYCGCQQMLIIMVICPWSHRHCQHHCHCHCHSPPVPYETVSLASRFWKKNYNCLINGKLLVLKFLKVGKVKPFWTWEILGYLQVWCSWIWLEHCQISSKYSQ